MRLSSLAQQWNVTIENTFETGTSFIAYGRREELPVVLKIIKVPGDEWHSGEVLKAFKGDGMVRAYESNAGAVLLERLIPGNDLVSLVLEGDDEGATRILAEVIRETANHPPPPDCPSIHDWGRAFDRYLKTEDNSVPRDLVNEAAEMYRRLAESSSRTMLLHGDLHHYNVLFDSNRNWVGIDPKGLVGELEYEVGAIFRNPMELPDLFTSPAVVERRLQILTETLHLDQQRALEWSFAQAVLSAIWDIEDGNPVAPNLPCLSLAQTIKNMLR